MLHMAGTAIQTPSSFVVIIFRDYRICPTECATPRQRSKFPLKFIGAQNLLNFVGPFQMMKHQLLGLGNNCLETCQQHVHCEMKPNSVYHLRRFTPIHCL